MRTLSVDELRSFYDRFGAKLDTQLFYERKAQRRLVSEARLGEARHVFEFGCGTGHFALELLQDHLAPTCRYLGVDMSATMMGLASARLERYGARASVIQTSGAMSVPAADGSVDRFISTYVLDLLSEPDAQQLISEARRVLRRDGLLCVVSTTPGTTRSSRIVMSIWRWFFSRWPSLVGGCRPVRVADMLRRNGWMLVYCETVVEWGVASEVVVATPADRRDVSEKVP